MDTEVDPLEAPEMRRSRSQAGTKLTWVTQQGMNARGQGAPGLWAPSSSTHTWFLLPLCLLGLCVGSRTE